MTTKYTVYEVYPDELTIDDGARAKVARVLAHAETHPYRPPYGTPPGDDDRFVARLNDFRAVFSFTYSGGVIWRHLSISVPGTKYPNPFAVYTIADMFGFTGWDQRTIEPPPAGWAMDMNAQERCIIIAQAVKSEMDKSAAN